MPHYQENHCYLLLSKMSKLLNLDFIYLSFFGKVFHINKLVKLYCRPQNQFMLKYMNNDPIVYLNFFSVKRDVNSTSSFYIWRDYRTISYWQFWVKKGFSLICPQVMVRSVSCKQEKIITTNVSLHQKWSLGTLSSSFWRLQFHQLFYQVIKMKILQDGLLPNPKTRLYI